MQVNAEIQGVEEALKKLRNVDQRVSLRVIRGALRYGAKPAIERAKQLVPVDSSAGADDYSLKDSIGLRAERKKNRAGNATSMRFGAHRVTSDGGAYAIKGGLNKGAKAPNYASLVEDETPFLKPAIEQTADQVIRRFGDKIVQSVSKL